MKFEITRSRVYWVVGIGIALFAGWYLFFHTGGGTAQILVVHPTTFVQQLSVSGTVQAGQEVDLGFAASGRVSGVYAAVGQRVEAGALIAQTENGDLRASLAQKQASLQAQQATLASLEAGTRPESIAVSQAQVASDQGALAQANAAVADAIQTAYTQSDDAVHNKADQFFSNARTTSPSVIFTTSNQQIVTTLIAERVAAETMLASWEAHVAALSPASDLSAAEVEAQTNLAAVIKLLTDANAALNAAIPGSSVSQSSLDTYTASISAARSNVNAAASALTSDIGTQRAAAAVLAKDQKSLDLAQAGSTSQDIAAQEAQVAAAQADVESAQAQLGKTQVVAPFTGTITKMDAKVGEITSPATSEISMMSDGLFQIQTFIPEVEIVGLAVGNPATTTLDAYGPSVPFAAKVVAIDPAETVTNGVATYKTTLQFAEPDPRIKSGMTASVLITTQAIPNALVVPQGAVFEKNGQRMLQLQRGDSVVDVPVVTNTASSIGNVEVTSGLSDGDSVILNPDTAK